MKRIDKFMLLQATNGGLDFYQFVFHHKLMPSATENKMENVLNPFYEDTKPSFSIYLKSVKDESETYKSMILAMNLTLGMFLTLLHFIMIWILSRTSMRLYQI